jgi:fluoride exporter
MSHFLPETMVSLTESRINITQRESPRTLRSVTLEGRTGRQNGPFSRCDTMGRMRTMGEDTSRSRRVTGDTRTLRVVAAIAVGGGLGSMARHALAISLPSAPPHLPWATFAANVSGCFALGLLMVFVLDVWPPRLYVRPFLGIGVLGGYTTFSSVTVETIRLTPVTAVAYALGTLAACLVAVWCGMTVARLAARAPLRGRAGRGAG